MNCYIPTLFWQGLTRLHAHKSYKYQHAHAHAHTHIQHTHTHTTTLLTWEPLYLIFVFTVSHVRVRILDEFLALNFLLCRKYKCTHVYLYVCMRMCYGHVHMHINVELVHTRAHTLENAKSRAHIEECKKPCFVRSRASVRCCQKHGPCFHRGIAYVTT
jgi:hypothetical protein